SVRDGSDDRYEEEGHPAKERAHIAQLPDQRLQCVVFDKPRVLLDAENDQRRDETSENLQQVREKCHCALVFRGYIRLKADRLAGHLASTAANQASAFERWM